MVSNMTEVRINQCVFSDIAERMHDYMYMYNLIECGT